MGLCICGMRGQRLSSCSAEAAVPELLTSSRTSAACLNGASGFFFLLFFYRPPKADKLCFQEVL